LFIRKAFRSVSLAVGVLEFITDETQKYYSFKLVVKSLAIYVSKAQTLRNRLSVGLRAGYLSVRTATAGDVD